MSGKLQPMSRWAITGGSGFLGIHLAQRLLARGDAVQTLDLEQLDAELVARGANGIVGDICDATATSALAAEADVLVHAAAALPIQGSGDAIRRVNVDGTATVLAAAAEAGVGRVILISTTAVYGVPRVHPITEETPIVPLGAYGSSKVEAERVSSEFAARGLETVVLRPKTFLGPGRLGVFEILFDWISEGRRIYTIGSGRNRYQLLAVEDLVDAILCAAEQPVGGEVYNLGAKEFGTVAEDLQALIDHAGSSSRLTPLPAKPIQLVLRGLELARVSPLAEWHYKTADKDSFVSIERAERELGWTPQRSNAHWWQENRESLTRGPGLTHRVPWDQRALSLAKRIS